jgi:hypothetical protein
MWQWIESFALTWAEHFLAVIFYGIIPFAVFSALNFLIASLFARRYQIDLADARLLGLSFGAIGIAAGLFVGASRESVVGTVVPALLTFMSGFAVYQFGKESYERWRPALPVALVCLVIGAICAATFGASQRNHYIESQRRYEEWKMQYEKLELPLRVRQLEKQLGLTPDQAKGTQK